MEPTTNHPTFSADASTGQTLSTDSFKGKVPLAMLFIPDGSERTTLFMSYNDAHGALAERRVQLLAVTPDTAAEARQMAADLDLTFPILSGPSLEIFREFAAVDDTGAPRACSVVVDKTGTVASVTDGVVSPQEMMTRLDELEGSNRFEMAVSR